MAALMHRRPFRAARESVQPLAAQDSFLPCGKKILIWHHFPAIIIHASSHGQLWYLWRLNMFSMTSRMLLHLAPMNYSGLRPQKSIPRLTTWLQLVSLFLSHSCRICTFIFVYEVAVLLRPRGQMKANFMFNKSEISAKVGTNGRLKTEYYN